jgi:hypothetical protein
MSTPSKKSKPIAKTLRFAVGSVLLIGVSACGPAERYVNEPAPPEPERPTVNEPYVEDEVAEEPTEEVFEEEVRLNEPAPEGR